MKTRDEAHTLLKEYTQSESLLKHAYSVEAAMRWYAIHFKQSENEIEKWGITGLLHDFDYEKYPDPTPPNGHPYYGNTVLKELNYPEDTREAIMGHALYTEVPRTTLMAKTLFAVDELCGLITAATLVRPDRSLHTITAKSVKKKMKDKAFAKGVNREDIQLGAKELDIELSEHIENTIQGMQKISETLGLYSPPMKMPGERC